MDKKQNAKGKKMNKTIKIFLLCVFLCGFVAFAQADQLRHGVVICENPGISGCLTNQTKCGGYLTCIPWTEYIKEEFDYPISGVQIERLELIPKSQFKDADSHMMLIYFTYFPVEGE